MSICVLLRAGRRERSEVQARCAANPHLTAVSLDAAAYDGMSKASKEGGQTSFKHISDAVAAAVQLSVAD